MSKGLLNISATPGDFLILLSAPNWALFTVLSKRMVGKLSPALTLMYVMFAGWLAILPLFALSGRWIELPRLTGEGWRAVCFLGLLCSGAAYIFWYDALNMAGASQVAAFLYIEPFVTLIVAARLIHEPITWASLVGGAIILLGVWLVNRPTAASMETRIESLESRV
jgi:drug/metabolite transporter (DMT)-like permease